LEGAAGLRPVLVGTPADALFHQEFLSACPSAVNLEGQTSLGGMAALASQGALFVGSDSGPMHVAAAVGARVVAVFGPGAPHKTAPYLPPERLRVVYAELPCSPCRQAFWKECRPCPSGKPPCLEGIHPGAVLGACMELLRLGS
jgi:ADP-heptose:LPS heptosyltransferase